jgi:hypothetical protein
MLRRPLLLLPNTSIPCVCPEPVLLNYRAAWMMMPSRCADGLADSLLGLPVGPYPGSTDGASALLEEAVQLVSPFVLCVVLSFLLF